MTPRYVLDIAAVESLLTHEPRPVTVHVNADNSTAVCGEKFSRPSLFNSLEWAEGKGYGACPACFADAVPDVYLDYCPQIEPIEDETAEEAEAAACEGCPIGGTTDDSCPGIWRYRETNEQYIRKERPAPAPLVVLGQSRLL